MASDRFYTLNYDEPIKVEVVTGAVEGIVDRDELGVVEDRIRHTAKLTHAVTFGPRPFMRSSRRDLPECACRCVLTV